MWHYTTLPKLKAILESGALLPTSYPGEDFFRPSLWFSSNSIWEPTAAKRLALANAETGEVLHKAPRRLTFQEHRALLGLVRIAAPPNLRLLDYLEWQEQAQVSAAFAASLALGGLEMGGKPTDWFATFQAIPVWEWPSLEIYEDSTWRSV